MNESPHRVADHARELHPVRVRDGRQVADSGHAALIAIRKGLRAGLACQPGADQPADVGALLYRGLGHRRQVVQPDHVPDGEDLRVTRQAAVRPHRDPACPIGIGAGRLGQHRRQRGGLHPGRPDLRPGRNTPVAVGALDRDTGLVHGLRRGVQQDVHAHPPQPAPRVALQLGGERGEHLRAGLDQQDGRFRRGHRSVLPRQRFVRELGDLAGHLNSGRSGSYDREGQVRCPLGRVGGQLSHLEGAENMAAETAGVLQGLQARREHGPFRVPEIGIRAPGRDHQTVIRQRQRPAVRGHRAHNPSVQIQVLDIGQHDARVGLLPDHAAQRRRNEAIRQDSGSDLIQQRLEQVVIGPVYDRDVGIGAGQGTRHPDPAEPATDDDHLVSSFAHEDSISGRGWPSERPEGPA